MAIHFSLKFKNLRKSRDLTQEQVADIFHVSPQAVSRWETGASYPDIESLPSIAEFFKITVDDLLGVDVIKNQERADILKKEIRDKAKQHLWDETDEVVEFCRKAAKEFPNDYEILSLLAGYLKIQGLLCLNRLQDKQRHQKCTSEAIDIYERIIEYSPNGSASYYEALTGLITVYSDNGNREKAREIAGKLPNGYQDNYRFFMARVISEGEEKINRIRTNIIDLADSLYIEMESLFYGNNPDTVNNII